ncbi:cytidine deaminase [Aquaticitalea lipolytica]|uniref:Cytidine deaminase n=1 Tax=Aquaticitalea lipolytica TaxID=1247562 RepID=A0A8J2TS06_9FLAO|nr:anti-phage dCTP deaminase [Aquaticitalea lipolytica]GFZ89206.1 cytidine deaminase [Aquaticitalea lipolytica]
MSIARKLNNQSSDNQISKNSDKTTSERVKETHTSELVLGICSQIGAKKDLVIKALKSELKSYGYEFMDLKLSKHIDDADAPNFKYNDSQDKTSGYNTIVRKIEKGNHLREIYGKDYLVNLSVSEIANSKMEIFKISGEKDFSNISSQRKCYIIDSIKHKEELNALRDIYGDAFYLISVFTPRSERIQNISIPNIAKNEAIEIINIDEYQEFKESGQQVREVYVDADFFIKVDKKNETEIKSKIERFTNIIFENELITPTIEERAMYEAKSASVNSACLSRQVGASIISNEDELISVGWNDVPKYGGNLYTHESKIDNRCYIKGQCFNDSNKENIRNVILDDFKAKIDKVVSDDLEKSKILNVLNKVLLSSSIKTLIEFSRSVHAEMHAILNAANLNGVKLRGSTLFCTTYPCHNCVRHIIAAGIIKLYYIEPYIKSKGIDLHSDSITDDTILTKDSKNDKVQILMFEGISPKKYLSFFNKNRSRKNKISGKSLCQNRDKSKLQPINSLSLQALFYREIQASKRIQDRIDQLSSKNENQ